MQEDNNPFGPVIYSYSRAQAIADGVLGDLSQFPIIRQQWKMPMACTDAVWSIIAQAVSHGNDLAGVLHDIGTMARHAIHAKKDDTDTIHFQVVIRCDTHPMKLHCGPGDTPLPVLTLMLKNES